ncbi:CdaR family transcriptional regulator [Salisediminibacterium selenitireducens]|uniref:Transcriptional regulator, CdaR n=1 Tax=Bacillus selenitireducens (strain ATCC 700615 / DSM 15326 / MLS10) TaxID=439292 RepID=D6XWS1_BACIE|nr:sugar diacid recognition domain-containing protein [Salisediminibacterium selenitireducens]ADH99897.1 transcriptional regulator, CdaR [[Bacillus] selenitireducens MLS10]
MELLTGVASRIVNEVTEIVREEVIVVDQTGTIIAASDRNRIGNFHEGAKIAVDTGKHFIIRKRDVPKLKGVKAGLNLPIMIDGSAVGVIGITGEPSKVIQFGQLIQRMTELIIKEAYSSELLDSKHRGYETFVYEWVNIQDVDFEFRERGEILGIRLDRPKCCILIDLMEKHLTHQDGSALKRATDQTVTDYLRLAFEQNPQDFVVPWGAGRFMVVKDMNEPVQDAKLIERELKQILQEIDRQFQFQAQAGVGTVVHVPEELRRSYQEAKRAISAKGHSEKVVFYSELSLELALAEISTMTRERLIEKVIGSIMNEKDLMDTLDVFIEHNLRLKPTAEALHIHINTLHYRLKRISELTGKSVKRTEDIVSLYIAVHFYHDQAQQPKIV